MWLILAAPAVILSLQVHTRVQTVVLCCSGGDMPLYATTGCRSKYNRTALVAGLVICFTFQHAHLQLTATES